MKTILLLLLVTIPAMLFAQNRGEIRLNGYASYVFDDHFSSYYSATDYYDGTLKGGLLWGAGLEYILAPHQGIELMYFRQDTHSPTTYYDPYSPFDPVKNRDFDVALNHIFLGSTRYFRVTDVVEPYGGIKLGVAIIGVSNSVNNQSNTVVKFAWGLKGGTNLWFSSRVGLKLEAGLNSVTQAVGGGLYFDYTGVSAGTVSYSTILMFSLGGGLVVNLNGR